MTQSHAGPRPAHRRAIVLVLGLVTSCLVAAMAHAGDTADVPEPAAADLELPDDFGSADWLLPEWRYAPDEDWGVARRATGRGAKVGYDFVNDLLSDSVYTLKSPLHWRWREWLLVGTTAGITTGLIYVVDEPLRDGARGSEGFEKFGEGIRWMGQGGALIGLTGGFLLSGLALDRPKDLETAKLLLEASAIGYGYGVWMKHTAGRFRPRENQPSTRFEPFSGNLSMPSGEALNVFLLAGVVTSQYPAWWVQVLSYGLAGATSVGRIALDAHWGSDVFVSAVIGIAVSKAIVKLNRKRKRDLAIRRELELRGDATPSLRKVKRRHYFGATARSVRWTIVF